MQTFDIQLHVNRQSSNFIRYMHTTWGLKTLYKSKQPVVIHKLRTEIAHLGYLLVLVLLISNNRDRVDYSSTPAMTFDSTIPDTSDYNSTNCISASVDRDN